MPKLTKELLQEKVFKNSLETCDYISGYKTQDSIIKVKCRKHQYEFNTKWENVRRAGRAHHICPLCQEEDKKEQYSDNRVEVICSYCEKKFIKSKSKLENSKSGLYFCCREHKDLAQRITSGKQFEKIRPSHYGIVGHSTQNYRRKAFNHYENKCGICGYDEELNILQVHHIDENRLNNDISNLIILCPNCHAKITWGKYILKDRKFLIKK